MIEIDWKYKISLHGRKIVNDLRFCLVKIADSL